MVSEGGGCKVAVANTMMVGYIGFWECGKLVHEMRLLLMLKWTAINSY